MERVAQEVLEMKKKAKADKANIMDQLRNIIVTKRHVNCYSHEFTRKNEKVIEQLLAQLESGSKHFFLAIDIRQFDRCEEQAQEANIFLDLLNSTFETDGGNRLDIEPISTANILIKWSEVLEGRVLLVFHCFYDPSDEKEKNILRSLREAIPHVSRYLGILIISTREVSDWELFPESNLDNRHVAFFDVF